MVRERTTRRPGFTELLLGGVLLLIITLTALAAALYVAPSERLAIPELQPVIRVERESNFPVGATRNRSWGERIILVIRPDSTRYFALEGVSPVDGCLLQWDQESLRVFSPCGYAEYDLRGDVVAGLSTQSLTRYAVSVRNGVVYVSDEVR
ncbi:MAG: hypothetical protein GWN99_05365 [Gemmatimonadetes bacterium]|uniref:Rieske domain-containing protein n=1 Tax=Candidatus Kutchimonas denitrificans TaxID=3056748 RepID=A0AAE4Z970_9BACT|nr:hypothetical protein [Gemmatimonadota bacterium]NIR76115.1 hypothetical protein [Candidatus Kutchimonas denitrificans]NIS00494.1 hypothetical protein [Gemmatimonadota bacterium]NIT66152.1 hypothetical protein [Gemmatimonadota bacterium]NIU54230.1 hypothetical protein [Gemmatimonadota bacterium]